MPSHIRHDWLDVCFPVVGVPQNRGYGLTCLFWRHLKQPHNELAVCLIDYGPNACAFMCNSPSPTGWSGWLFRNMCAHLTGWRLLGPGDDISCPFTKHIIISWAATLCLLNAMPVKGNLCGGLTHKMYRGPPPNYSQGQECCHTKGA